MGEKVVELKKSGKLLRINPVSTLAWRTSLERFDLSLRKVNVPSGLWTAERVTHSSATCRGHGTEDGRSTPGHDGAQGNQSRLKLKGQGKLVINHRDAASHAKETGGRGPEGLMAWGCDIRGL